MASLVFVSLLAALDQIVLSRVAHTGFSPDGESVAARLTKSRVPAN